MSLLIENPILIPTLFSLVGLISLSLILIIAITHRDPINNKTMDK